jgi:hypothetical protein
MARVLAEKSGTRKHIEYFHIVNNHPDLELIAYDL